MIQQVDEVIELPAFSIVHTARGGQESCTQIPRRLDNVQWSQCGLYVQSLAIAFNKKGKSPDYCTYLAEYLVALNADKLSLVVKMDT